MKASLLDLLSKDLARPDSVRSVVAKVTGVVGRTVDLDVQGGAVTGVPYADSYPSPAAGDVVYVVKTGSSWLVLASIGKGYVSGGPNLAPNPGFEFGTLGAEPSQWGGFWGTGGYTGVQVSNTTPHGGDYCARTANVSGATQHVKCSPVLALTSGVQYRFGFWARTSSTAGAPTVQGLLCRNDDVTTTEFFATGLAQQTVVGSTALTTSWKYLEGLYTIPADSKPVGFLSLYVGCGSSGYVYLDDVTFRTV